MIVYRIAAFDGDRSRRASSAETSFGSNGNAPAGAVRRDLCYSNRILEAVWLLWGCCRKRFVSSDMAAVR